MQSVSGRFSFFLLFLIALAAVRPSLASDDPHRSTAASAIAAPESIAQRTGTAAPSIADDPACAGTIVDLSCDSVRPAGGVARCDTGEHYFALKTDGTAALRPLELASGPALDRLRAGGLTGQQVRVVGSCPARGPIRVHEVVPLG
jgi:hypothetical protein